MPCAYVVEYLNELDQAVCLKVGYAKNFKQRFASLKNVKTDKFNYAKCVERLTVPCETKEQGMFIESLLRLHYSNFADLDGNDHFMCLSFNDAPIPQSLFDNIQNVFQSKPMVEQSHVINTLLETQSQLAQTIADQSKMIQEIKDELAQQKSKKKRWLF